MVEVDDCVRASIFVLRGSLIFSRFGCGGGNLDTSKGFTMLMIFSDVKLEFCNERKLLCLVKFDAGELPFSEGDEDDRLAGLLATLEELASPTFARKRYTIRPLPKSMLVNILLFGSLTMKGNRCSPLYKPLEYSWPVRTVSSEP